MKYIVIELQTAADGSVANIVTSHDTRDSAESQYHSVLASAAISQLPRHGAVLLTSECTFLEAKCYAHEQEAGE